MRIGNKEGAEPSVRPYGRATGKRRRRGEKNFIPTNISVVRPCERATGRRRRGGEEEKRTALQDPVSALMAEQPVYAKKNAVYKSWQGPAFPISLGLYII